MRIGQSLRYAMRTLARTPGFTATAILTLALGIGATTAMMTVVNSVLFKPLPFFDADRLYIVRTDVRPPDGRQVNAAARIDNLPINARHFYEWRRACASCEDVALVAGDAFTLTGGGNSARFPSLAVSYNFFRTLGVRPRLGRDFTPEDEGPAGYHVILLSDALWRSYFGADPTVVGRSIQLNGQAHTIVGVMPPDLNLPRGEQWGAFFAHNLTPLVFRPVGLDLAGAKPIGNFNFAAVVRMKAGAAPERAQSEMTTNLSDFSRDSGVRMSARLVPMADQVTGGARRPLWMLLAGVAAVLTLVSLNVGGLLLARGVSQSRDASIRLALGANRADLVSAMLTEVALLVTCGGAFGALMSAGAIRGFVAAAPIDLPRLSELHADWRTLAFTLAAAAASAALAALAPLCRLLRADLASSIRAATRSATASKGSLLALDAVMVAEIALSTVVLVVGALLVSSFLNVLGGDRGFETRNVVTQALSLSGQRYPTADTRNAFIALALERFSHLPGVTSAGVTSQLPLRGETWVDSLQDADHPRNDAKDPPPLTNRRFVSAGYFSAMGISLRAGRDIADADRNHFVAVLSERAARLLWPGESPIGRRVASASTGLTPDHSAAVVIGIVADVRTAGLEAAPAPIVYEPYWQLGPSYPAFVLRTDRDAGALSGDIRGAVKTLDADIPFEPTQTMHDIVAASSALRRFQTTLVALFALVALLIAAMGLYGLVSLSVARRTRELGLRIALGATKGRIAAMVVRQGTRPVAIGGLIGLAGAAAGGNLLASQLYGINAHDPRVLAGVIGTLGVVAVAACWIPARRATKVDPMIPLRAE